MKWKRNFGGRRRDGRGGREGEKEEEGSAVESEALTIESCEKQNKLYVCGAPALKIEAIAPTVCIQQEPISAYAFPRGR